MNLSVIPLWLLANTQLPVTTVEIITACVTVMLACLIIKLAKVTCQELG